MHDTLSARLQHAGNHVTTPDVPLQLIAARANDARKRGKLRAIALGIGFTFASAGAAAAFGSNLLDGLRLWFTGDNVRATVYSLAIVNAPTAKDLRELIRSATFPVVLPVGLPPGTRLAVARFTPANHPNYIELEYINESVKLDSSVALFDSSAFEDGETPANPSRADVWRMGRENVHVGTRMKTAALVHAAMLHSNEAASFAATLPMLANATILGNARGSYKIAARYGPPDGSAILIGAVALRSIPVLEKRREPLLDSHIVYLTNVPNINRQPDYSKATLTWPHTVVIKAAGVRAIAKVLRLVGGSELPTTAVLFDNSAAFRIAVIEGSLLSPHVQEFSVDPRTSKVTKLPAG